MRRRKNRRRSKSALNTITVPLAAHNPATTTTKTKNKTKSALPARQPVTAAGHRDLAAGLAADLFLRLVRTIGQPDSETMADVLALLPDGADWHADAHGNLYVSVPGPAGAEESRTLFAAHLDTVARGRTEQRPEVFVTTDGDLWAASAGDHILGADDRAGCAVLIYMIGRGVPGTYAFFTEEERGGIGSGKAADDLYDAAKKGAEVPYDHVVSFDRRGTTSIITHQGMRTASQAFALALAEAYEKAGVKGLRPDDTGSFTDSASFTDTVSECTNVSVGYTGAHTPGEMQNLTFLNRLAEASCKVEWSTLPAVRTPGSHEYPAWDDFDRYGSYGRYDRYGLYDDRRSYDPRTGRESYRSYEPSAYWTTSRITALLRRAEEDCPDLVEYAFGSIEGESILDFIKESLDDLYDESNHGADEPLPF